MLSFTCAKEDTLFLHVLLLAMERRWLLSVSYLHLCLLYSSVGQTPDNNEDITAFQLYEGDILLTPAEERLREELSNPNNRLRSQRAVVNSDDGKWPNGIVPYEIDNSLSPQAKVAIQDAIDEYTRRTCITFRPKNFVDRHYVNFYPGEGCNSFIGRIGGRQNISIGSECETKGVVMHEIFHALGRWHEQSRPDRDLFVNVNNENIRSGYEGNFNTAAPDSATTQGIPYDYDSIMHYNAYAFSRDRSQPTIEPRSRNISLNRLGQRRGFSELDLHHVNILYCGGSSTIGHWSEWGPWSDCSASCNGGTQTRTRRCVWDMSCPGRNIQRRNCNEASCPISATWGPWSMWSGCSRSCGGGRRTRLRTCRHGNTCVGRNQQFEPCNSQRCPVAMEWSEWGSWGECSQTCQGGLRSRRRFCMGGDACGGRESQQEECNVNISCESQVGEWTRCSKTCGGGVQFRRVADRVENRSCNNQECHNEPCLRGLIHLGCYRLPNLTLQLYENEAELLTEDPSNRREPVRKCGSLVGREQHTLFALALGTCYGGSDDVTDYTLAGESQACDRGRGNFHEGYLSIDVYNITDLALFQESASSSEACGADFCVTEETFCSSAVPPLTSSHLVMAFTWLVAVFLYRTMLQY